MKFTIEVTEEELSAELSANLKKMVLARAASWRTSGEIQREIDAQWNDTLAAIVKDAMSDVPALRAKVLEKIERRLTAQVNAAMRIKDDSK